MFYDESLTLDELIDYYIGLYEKETNNNTKMILLEKLNELYEERDNNDTI